MSQQGPILVVSASGRPPFASALDETKLFPVVNSDWLKKNDKGAQALNKLSATLTTEDLATLIGKVDTEREVPVDVAKAYLKDKGLV